MSKGYKPSESWLDELEYWGAAPLTQEARRSLWYWRDEPFWKPIRGVPDDPFAGIGGSESAIRRRARKEGLGIVKSQFRNPDNGPVGYFVFRLGSRPPVLAARCRSLEHVRKYLMYYAR